MLKTLSAELTVCSQVNEDGFLTIAGLANGKGLAEGNKLELFLERVPTQYEKIAETTLDEFCYFELVNIKFEASDLLQSHLYIRVNENMLEKVNVHAG
ncbi:hypothetical protein HXA34_17445 [Salipaludibacillus agaradhaerens]|jgi:hypothetical protein|uniref:hypothetical protein n=1 Tax=Salipaludibacillus agaradhaerens TaxID=76935 RepID=UPI002151195C|nr:hypothetical protein [Salipaludibacillus agaradhaerens]MCR6108082.1 hypothetical protein [Salipaludibacillus agaradhaerens]MCR6120107.1 hypothetical protein [Salipaludibacillus agaradhaerens]